MLLINEGLLYLTTIWSARINQSNFEIEAIMQTVFKLENQLFSCKVSVTFGYPLKSGYNELSDTLLITILPQILAHDSIKN